MWSGENKNSPREKEGQTVINTGKELAKPIKANEPIYEVDRTKLEVDNDNLSYNPRLSFIICWSELVLV